MFKRRDVPFFPVMGTSLRPGIWPKVLIGLMLLWRASSAVAGLNPAEIVDPRFADEALGPGLRRAAKRTFASAEPARADDRNRMAMYVRLDNDSFAGSDRGYTNGIRIGFTSPTVASFDDSRLPAPLRWLDRRLAWMQPRGFEDYNVTLAIGQGMFTPEDRRPRVPDPLDRPYAGVLVASVTYNGRDAHSMHSTTLELGLVGPSTLAEQTQDFVHDRLGSDEFRGWDHQLRDEPVARIIHQRLRKRVLARGPGMADAIVHYGGSIGNLATFANAGVELRFGRTLPDNFGTAPSLPAVENTAPSRTPLFATSLGPRIPRARCEVRAPQHHARRQHLAGQRGRGAREIRRRRGCWFGDVLARMEAHSRALLSHQGVRDTEGGYEARQHHDSARACRSVSRASHGRRLADDEGQCCRRTAAVFSDRSEDGYGDGNEDGNGAGG